MFNSVTISDPTTTNIAQTSTITYSALATMQIDFATPHGLVPGNAFLVVIQSDDGANNHILASGHVSVTAIQQTQLRYSKLDLRVLLQIQDGKDLFTVDPIHSLYTDHLMVVYN